jgi:hypothetical protein
MTTGGQSSDYVNYISDFWWLPEDVAIDKLSVGIGHHKPLTDEDDPYSVNWFHSLSKDELLSVEEVKYSFGFLSSWRDICDNTNIYRTLKVFGCNTEEAILLGPFLIDIDNSEENLDDARTITTQVRTYLLDEQKISKGDMRIFFSGRKGFNVEVRPEAFGVADSISGQIKCFSMKLDEIIDFLRKNNKVQNDTRNMASSQGTCIDRIYGDRFGYKLKHPYIRLHNSVNKWIRGSDSEITRMKIELTIEQLCNMSATEISSKSEELARIPQQPT